MKQQAFPEQTTPPATHRRFLKGCVGSAAALPALVSSANLYFPYVQLCPVSK